MRDFCYICKHECKKPPHTANRKCSFELKHTFINSLFIGQLHNLI